MQHPRSQIGTVIRAGRLRCREPMQETLEAEPLLPCLVAALGSSSYQACQRPPQYRS